jgi:hypothetical protein
VSQRTQNFFHYSRKIGINIRIPKPKNPEALRLQKGVARLIGSSAVRHSVLTAVSLDSKFATK